MDLAEMNVTTETTEAAFVGCPPKGILCALRVSVVIPDL
jgi:hypothetical protein